MPQSAQFGELAPRRRWLRSAGDTEEREAAAYDLAKRPRYCVVALSVCNRRGDRAILQVPGRDPEGQARRSFNPARCDNDNGLIGQLPLPRTPLPPLDPLCSRYTSTCASVRVLGKMKNLDGHEHIVSLLLLRLLLLEMPCRLQRDKTTEPRPVPRRRGRSATNSGESVPLSFAFGRTRRDDGQGDSAGAISIVAVSPEQKKACHLGLPFALSPPATRWQRFTPSWHSLEGKDVGFRGEDTELGDKLKRPRDLNFVPGQASTQAQVGRTEKQWLGCTASE
ncbi:hypothetical protein MRX96_043994 [Rhipicephalus microplus]